MCLNGTYDWFISIMCNFFTCISQGMQHKGQRMQSELGNKIAKTWNFVMIALINISPNPVPFLWDFPYKGFKEHTKTAGRNICFFVILLWGLIPFLCNIVFILSSSLAENKADIEYRLPACLKITFMFFFLEDASYIREGSFPVVVIWVLPVEISIGSIWKGRLAGNYNGV